MEAIKFIFFESTEKIAFLKTNPGNQCSLTNTLMDNHKERMTLYMEEHLIGVSVLH